MPPQHPDQSDPTQQDSLSGTADGSSPAARHQEWIPTGPPQHGWQAPQGSHDQQGQSTQSPYGQQGYGQQGYGQAPYPQSPHPPSYPRQVVLRTDYAHWGKRVLAFLIDSVPTLIGQILFFVGYVTWLVSLAEMGAAGATLSLSSPGVAVMVIGVVALLLGLGWTIYNRWVVAGRTGQSLGKRVMRISLIREETAQPIGPVNAFVRDLLHIVDGVAYVGYLWPLWDEKRQTFADKLISTIVITQQDAGPAA